jgi:hypothetical protein
VRNASPDAAAVDRDGSQYAGFALVPATRRAEVVTLGFLGARRMLASVICARTPK